MDSAHERDNQPYEQEVLEQTRYDREAMLELGRQQQETQRREERQRRYGQDDIDRLKAQADQSQQGQQNDQDQGSKK